MMARVTSCLMKLSYDLHRMATIRLAPFRALTSAPGVNIDPFGLGDVEEAELSATVQGIYSSSTQEFQSKIKGTEEDVSKDKDPTVVRGQLYSSWIEETRTARRVNKLIGVGSEFARTADFGAIRFDHDNVPRLGQEDEEEGDYFFDNRLTEEPTEIPPGTTSTHNNAEQEQRVSSTAQSVEETTPDSDTTTLSPRIAAILKKDKLQVTANRPSSAEIPAIYQLHSLNNLTRAEVWNLLRDNVVFQNEFMVAINKPYGLPMHTPSNDCRHTILDFLDELTTYCKSSEKVYPLHRLDKDTTGVLLFAKTQIAATIIKEKFAKQEIRKKYLVITKNCPPMNKGTIDIPIAEGRVGGDDIYRSVLKPDLRSFKISSSQRGAKRALTHFTVISTSDSCSFMEVRPETGVKHQIRIHLGMGLGCPVLGDHKYSHREKLAPQRLSPTVLKWLNIKQSKVRYLPLHLHCSAIEFSMPASYDKSQEPVFAHCRPPKHFMYTLRELKLK